MLAPEYFEERLAEVARWQARGYFELEDLVDGTEFTLDDLVELGVLIRNEPFLSVDIRSYLPAGAWANVFQEGSYQTCFLSRERRDDLLASLCERRDGR